MRPLEAKNALSAERAGGLARPLVLLLLAGVATLSYANTFHASFHFDDASSIVNNSQVKSFSAFRDLSASRYLGFLTFAVNYYVGGLNPVGYHVVNLLIHITNGFLVYTLVGLLGRTSGLGAGAPSREVALLTALLFVVHPIQTQAVTYIVQRIASLAALFYLLAVVCYLQWRLADSISRTRAWWYAAALAATLLAMKTKESSFTLPFMLLIVEGGFFRSASRRPWVALLPFLLMLPIIPWSLASEGAVGMHQGEAGLARETADIDRLSYLYTQCRVLVTYLRLLVWPVQQNLDYDYPIYDLVLQTPVWLSLLGLLGLLGLALYLFVASTRWRLVGFGVLWFFGTLSVESSIIPIRDVIFEHRVYLPSVGMLLAASVVAGRLLARWRLLPVVAVVVVVVLAGATYARNQVWADEITLWRDVVTKSPKKARVHHSLGHAYLIQGRLDEAVTELRTSIQLDPNFPDAHNSLGVAYGQQGQGEASIQEYQTAIRVKPNYAQAYFNLGVAYGERGQITEAIQEYRAAVQIKPDFPEVHYNLGQAYLAQGLRDDAIAEFRTTLRFDPDFPEAHGNLGVVYAQQGRLDEAIQEFLTTLRLKPNFPEAEAKLGNAYAQQGRWDDAIAHYQRALKLQADRVEVRFELGQVYLRKGLTREARWEFEAVMRDRPDFTPAQQALRRLDVQPQQPRGE